MGKFEKKNRPQGPGDRPLYYSNQQPVVSPRSAAPGNGAKRPPVQRPAVQRSAPPKQPIPEGPKKKKGSKLPLILGLVAAAVVLFTCVVGYLLLRDDGLIADQIYVAGIDLSGMTPEQAVAALEDVSFTETMNIRLYTRGDSFPTYTTTYDPKSEVVLDIFGKPIENAQQTDPVVEPEKPEADADAPLDENGNPYLRDMILCLR